MGTNRPCSPPSGFNRSAACLSPPLQSCTGSLDRPWTHACRGSRRGHGPPRERSAALGAPSRPQRQPAARWAACNRRNAWTSKMPPRGPRTPGRNPAARRTTAIIAIIDPTPVRRPRHCADTGRGAVNHMMQPRAVKHRSLPSERCNQASGSGMPSRSAVTSHPCGQDRGRRVGRSMTAASTHAVDALFDARPHRTRRRVGDATALPACNDACAYAVRHTQQRTCIPNPGRRTPPRTRPRMRSGAVCV